MTNVNRLEITSRGSIVQEIKLGGHPVYLTALDVRLRPEKIPIATIGLDVTDGIVVDVDVKTRLNTNTYEALVAMGWTPPKGETE